MAEKELNPINFFEEDDNVDDGNIQGELTEIESSYFNKVCINITNMTNSSINFLSA